MEREHKWMTRIILFDFLFKGSLLLYLLDLGYSPEWRPIKRTQHIMQEGATILNASSI